MSALAFDTYAAVKKLKEAGFTPSSRLKRKPRC